MAFPTGTLYTFRYDAATLAKGYPTRTLDAQLLAFVQERTSIVAIHSATRGRRSGSAVTLNASP
ncbi:MAG: hypothetical protein M3442_04205 [Chloroflexota bacterium]|nr:hypothetical protein [Chloroflexota bacterium]